MSFSTSQPMTMRCINKVFETQDTVTITLVPETPFGAIDFKPGQFVSLGVEINGKQHFRAYSISSVPLQPTLDLTIKKIEGGLVSSYVVDQLQSGDTVQVMAPTGQFNCIDVEVKPKIALFSAGSGITPVMSMMRYWLAQNADLDIAFIHSAREQQQVIFRDELAEIKAKHTNVDVHLFLSREPEHELGRLEQQGLMKVCPDLAERTFFMCGPEMFMADVWEWAMAAGADVDHIHQESFVPATVDQSTQGDDSAEVSVFVPDFGTTQSAEQGSTLADALEEADVPVIIACRSGICGSCKCKVIKGEVETTSTETLTEEEVAQGYVLACSSQLQSDVEVEIA